MSEQRRVSERMPMAYDPTQRVLSIPFGGGANGAVRVARAALAAFTAVLFSALCVFVMPSATWQPAFAGAVVAFEVPILAFIVWRTARPRPPRTQDPSRIVGKSNIASLQGLMFRALAVIVMLLGCLYWRILGTTNPQMGSMLVMSGIVGSSHFMCIASERSSAAAAMRWYASTTCAPPSDKAEGGTL